MNYSWLLLASGGGLSSSAFNYLNRYTLKDGGDSSCAAWWFELLRVFIFLPLLFFDYAIIVSYKTLVIAILLGVVEFMSIYLHMKMHRLNELSISSVIQRLKFAWVPIIAFLLLGEKLSMLNYTGMVIIFIGLTVVVPIRKLGSSQAIKIAVLTSLVQSILAVIMKIASDYLSTPAIPIVMGLPSLILFPALVSDFKRRSKNFWKANTTPLVGMAIMSVASLYLFVTALRIGDTSRVTGVYYAMMFTSVLAGIFLLKEKENVYRKIFGSLIILSGIYFLI